MVGVVPVQPAVKRIASHLAIDKDVLGIPAPADLDGTSLKLAITGSEPTSRTAFGETDYPLRFGWAPLRSVRSEGFKFIEAPRPELYDLSSDPGELRNGYVPWDRKTQKLRKMLADLNPKSAVDGKPSSRAVAPGTIDELRALGYLGAADAHSATDVPEPSLLPDPKDKIEEQNLLHIAMMASEDGQTERARTALERLLQLDSGSEIALLQLGRLEMESQNYKDATRYFERASKMRPEDAAVALDYGRALEISGDLSGAQRTLQALLKLDAKQLAAHLLLGEVYLKSNIPKRAEDEFEAAILLQPASVEAQTGLAKALLGEKKFPDAARFLEESTRSSGNNPDLFELLAQAYTGLGKPRQAQRAREQAKKLRATRKPN